MVVIIIIIIIKRDISLARAEQGASVRMVQFTSALSSLRTL